MNLEDCALTPEEARELAALEVLKRALDANPSLKPALTETGAELLKARQRREQEYAQRDKLKREYAQRRDAYHDSRMRKLAQAGIVPSKQQSSSSHYGLDTLLNWLDNTPVGGPTFTYSGHVAGSEPWDTAHQRAYCATPSSWAACSARTCLSLRFPRLGLETGRGCRPGRELAVAC